MFVQLVVFPSCGYLCGEPRHTFDLLDILFLPETFRALYKLQHHLIYSNQTQTRRAPGWWTCSVP